MKNYCCLLFLLLSVTAHTQIEELFSRAAQYQHFNGVVVVQNTNERQYEICKGDATAGNPIDTDTPFDIGSLTKQFTAAAILRLVAAGKVELQAPVNQYLDELGSKRWRNVNLHHLLTHTSGIPSLYQTEQGLETFMPQVDPISRIDLVDRFRVGKLQFSPGEEFAYSNSGYILLAIVVEKVTGLSFGEYLQQEFFSRYELTTASWGASSGAALPYYGYCTNFLRPAPVFHPSWMVGAAGVYASAEDLLRWLQIIQSNDFLNADLRAAYLESHTRQGYGYGWQVTTDGRIEHDGINAGFAAFVSFNPATNQQIVLLTNRGFEDIHLYGKSADKIRVWAEQIWNNLAGEKVEMLPAKMGVATLTGQYLLPTGDTLHLSRKDNALELTLAGHYPSRIVTNTPLTGEGQRTEKLRKISELLQAGKYWKVARYCDGEMKFVAYSGLLAIGFKQMKNRVGDLKEMTPCFLNESYGLIRMNGAQGTQDIICYFDEEGRIQGIFEHGFYLPEQGVVMYAYPVENGYYLDGFPYGEKSLNFYEKDDQLYFEQYDRTIKLQKL